MGGSSYLGPSSGWGLPMGIFHGCGLLGALDIFGRGLNSGGEFLGVWLLNW